MVNGQVYIFGFENLQKEKSKRIVTLAGMSNESRNKLEVLIEYSEIFDLSVVNSLVLQDINRSCVEHVEKSLESKRKILLLVHPVYLGSISDYLKRKFVDIQVETGYVGNEQAQISVQVCGGESFLNLEFQDEGKAR